MTRANSKIAVNNTSKNNKQSNRGCLKAIIILIIVMVSTFAVGLIYNYAIFLLSNGFR